MQLCTAIEEGEALGLQYIRDSSFLQVRVVKHINRALLILQLIIF